jgi:hypothetical protein
MKKIKRLFGKKGINSIKPVHKFKEDDDPESFSLMYKPYIPEGEITDKLNELIEKIDKLIEILIEEKRK